MRLSVILPASNEAGYIGACLQALLASDPVEGGAEVIVVANGCRDATADIARSFAPKAAAVGWELQVLDLAQGSKPGALNAGGAVARGAVLAWLDADVLVSPGLLASLSAALFAAPGPAYGSGRPELPRAQSLLSRAYGRFWMQLPFAQSTAPGFGLFAVNAAGRARWGAFPALISDDTFVRLQFTPAERLEVDETYSWPLVEGFARLVRVRRRQDQGVAELAARAPEIMVNGAHGRLSKGALVRLALRDPFGFAAYGVVSLAVRLGRAETTWTRGR